MSERLLLERIAGRARLWRIAAMKLSRTAVSQPLEPAEMMAVVIFTIAAGTLYCSVYCHIAYRSMHSEQMTLWLSAWWAGTALLPWVYAFELVKRRIPRARTRAGKATIFLVIAMATCFLTLLAAGGGGGFMAEPMPVHWRVLAANQLQPLGAFLLLVGWWSTEPSAAPAQDDRVDVPMDRLPPLEQIDWIRAAGNYVELRCGGRLLIRRMTMRAAEAGTRAADFVRTHRSMIVRRELIAGFVAGDRSRLELTTGERVPVGDSYRPAVARLVLSSRQFATPAQSSS